MACFLTIPLPGKKTGRDKYCHASVYQDLRDSRRKILRLPRRCAAALSRFSSRLSPFYLRENGSCSFGAAFADSPKPFIRIFIFIDIYDFCVSSECSIIKIYWNHEFVNENFIALCFFVHFYNFLRGVLGDLTI